MTKSSEPLDVDARARGEFADDEIREWLASLPATSDDMDLADVRAAREKRALTTPRETRLADVQNLNVAGLPARLYRPTLDSTPIVLYLHGGGWTVGSINTCDRLTRRLAHRSGLAVLSLDYRLAPENPWPASVDDTVAALEWIAAQPSELAGLGPVAVAGDSAGGTLATLACHRLRDGRSPALPELQILIYPNTDLTGSQPSMHEKATGYGLSADDVRYFRSQWVPDSELWSDPRVSPMHAPNLSGLPPAVIVTAEHDPLRDEGERYAERLAAAGVRVRQRREPGLIHSFMGLANISPACAAAADRIADDLQAHFQA